MRPGLRTKIALVIAIPLALEVYFLSSMLGSLQDVKKERVAETMTIETLVAVNLLLSDTVACGQILLFRPTDAPIFVPYSVLLDHQRKFRKLLRKKGAPKSPNIDAFVEAVEGLIGVGEMCDINQASDMFRLGIQDKMQASTWKITTCGEQVIQELSQLREEQASKSDKSVAAIRDNVIAGTVVAISLALLAVIYILREFGTAFSTLMRNTERVAKKETLLPPLKGKSELARLDNLIHSLSSEVEQAREQEKALLENSPVLMCSIGVDFVITEISTAVEEILQFRPYEIRGESLLSLIDSEEKQHLIKTLERCRQSNDPVTFECKLKTKQGKPIFSQWNVQWNPRNETFFGTVQDITIKKEAEKLKAEVVAMVSHDLRSPLASLSVSFDMMNQGFAGEFNDKGKEIIGETRDAIVSLMALINDLIEAEKLDSDSYLPHFEIVRIKSVLNELLGNLDEDAKWKEIKYLSDVEDIDIRADQDKITRVIRTFLVNAVRRSNKGGTIKVSCRRVDSESASTEMMEFRVEDFGPGLDQNQRQQIFERFSSVSTEGANLRFFLCRAIVEAHDGDIGADTTERESTVLWFKIPIH
jgi:PAS domain S-box-containing protein